MTLVANMTPSHHALIRAVGSASFVLTIALWPIPPSQLLATALLGVWVFFASLIRYVGLHAEPTSPAETFRSVPLRFSGPIGRFRLRPYGDGRRIEVRAGSQVVAEVNAADDGDAILLNPETVADSELDAFGAALGQAIEMAAAAEEDRPAERHVAGPASWGRS